MDCLKLIQRPKIENPCYKESLMLEKKGANIQLAFS